MTLIFGISLSGALLPRREDGVVDVGVVVEEHQVTQEQNEDHRRHRREVHPVPDGDGREADEDEEEKDANGQ